MISFIYSTVKAKYSSLWQLLVFVTPLKYKKENKIMSRNNDYNLPNQIRRYRLKRNLRLRDVRLLIGQSSVAHISHWEKGRKLPSLENSLKLAIAVKCPIEILFIEHYKRINKEVNNNKDQNKIELHYE